MGAIELDAIELVTQCPVEVIIEDNGVMSMTIIRAGGIVGNIELITSRSFDPFAYVVSANIRRRHLSIEDKDRLIVQLLKADPSKLNRQVAKLTDASHPHVAKVRKRAETVGDVEMVTTSVDTMGRKQPVQKKRRTRAECRAESFCNSAPLSSARCRS